MDANSVTRMGLVYSILQEHKLNIDSFAHLTIDKAFFEGHYFSDKAPGLSFMALPAVGLVLQTLRAAHKNTQPLTSDDNKFTNHLTSAEEFLNQFTNVYHASVWIACLITSSLFTALAAIILYYLGRHYEMSRQAALFGALAFGLSMPSAGWATVFFSHATAGACLFIAFALVIVVSDASGKGRHDGSIGLIIGALISWSVVVEFTGGVAAIVLLCFGIFRLVQMPIWRSKKVIAGAVIGGTIAALPLMIYNAMAFGSAFHIGYENVVGFSGMQHGFMGIGLPKLKIFWEITFGQYLGILWIAPLLILTPVAYWYCFRSLPFDVSLVLLLVPLCYVIINCGYYYWDGGYSTGPRHITPSLAFLAFAFVPFFDAATRYVRIALLMMGTFSGILSLICASTTMTSPNAFSRPLFQNIIPRLIEGRIHNALVYLTAPDLRTLLVIPLIWFAVFLLCSMLPQILSLLGFKSPKSTCQQST